LLETLKEDAPAAAKILEEAMTEACAVYMKNFPVDCSGATIASAWVKG